MRYFLLLAVLFIVSCSKTKNNNYNYVCVTSTTTVFYQDTVQINRATDSAYYVFAGGGSSHPNYLYNTTTIVRDSLFNVDTSAVISFSSPLKQLTYLYFLGGDTVAVAHPVIGCTRLN